MRSGARRRSVRVWLALAVAASLPIAACADYKPAPINAAESAGALEARSLDDPRLRSFMAGMTSSDRAVAVQPPRWDLSTLTLAAVYYQPQLEIAGAKLARAFAAIGTAAQRLNPVLTASPLQHLTVVEPSAWTVGFIVNFVVETFGKREKRIAQAEQLAEAARADLATAAWRVRGRVRSALLALWAAQKRQELLERRQALQEQLVGFLERLMAVGAASALDVSRERINLDQIRLAMQELLRQAAEARVQLAAAIGVPVRALDGVEVSLAAFDHPAGDDPTSLDLAESGARLRQEALVYRSEVSSSLAAYEAAQAALQLEIARQYPNVTLGPGYIFDQADHQYAVNLVVELPVFHQNQGPIAEVEALRREAAARFIDIQAQVIVEIDRAAASYRSALRARAVADRLFSGQSRRQQAVERALQAGEIDRVAVVTSALELINIDQSRFDVIVQQRQALELVEDALQRPLFEASNGLLFMSRPAK